MKGDNRYKFSRQMFKEASNGCCIYYLQRGPGFDSSTYIRLLFQTMNIIKDLFRVKLIVFSRI